MGSTWLDAGAMLGIFEAFVGALLLSSFKILLETIFGRFLIDSRPHRRHKSTVKTNGF